VTAGASTGTSSRPDPDSSVAPTRPFGDGDRPRGWRTVARRVAVAVWAVALVIDWKVHGIPIDREGLLLWIGAGLLAWTIGHRPLWTVVLDWLPFAAILVLYDLTRGIADTLARPTMWTPQITSDRWLGFGHDPTPWLQSHLKTAHASWWEVVVSTTYVSFFLAPYVIAGVLWLRDRTLWRRFAVLFVTISALGLIGFVLYPAAPPWAAAQCTAGEVADHPANPACMAVHHGRLDGGLLDAVRTTHPPAANYVERIGTRGFATFGLKFAAHTVDEGQATVNQVAAIPSLHAAISLLISLFLWRLVRRRWRPLLVLYPLLMAFSLVFSAEHYLTDILLGWLLTAVVWLAMSRRGRRRDGGRAGALLQGRDRDRAAAADTLAGSAPPNPHGDPACPPTETTPSSASPSAAASSSRRPTSTEEAAPPGTTARSASS
jgi:PAP2 superfamily